MSQIDVADFMACVLYVMLHTNIINQFTAGDHDYCNMPEPCENNQMYGFPGDCTKYYTCIHGNLFEMSCASGLEFDIEIGACVVEGTGVCQGDCIETTEAESPPVTTGRPVLYISHSLKWANSKSVQSLCTCPLRYSRMPYVYLYCLLSMKKVFLLQC